MSSSAEDGRAAVRKVAAGGGVSHGWGRQVMAEIIKRVIAAHREGREIRLVPIKQAVCSELKYAGRVPKTVEILAAVPQKFAFLVPLLKAKPVRSASGIAVVAVMCKPHRCPHITMTGNICVYWCVFSPLSLVL
jgi:elongator complex protein 3